jgi:methionine synthase II (cobalamin-independent)
MFQLQGLTTGIGSLPHQDAEQALDLVFNYCPQIPFWPQLPKRHIRESMTAQFSEGLPCLNMAATGVIFDSRDKDKQLEHFYEKIIVRDVSYFKISAEYARGLWAFYRRLKAGESGDIKFIKCQITGPFTFAAGINDQDARALLHNQIFFEAFTKGLLMKALWQIEVFKEFRKKIIVFIDEPYLACFGSAYTPIDRDRVIKVLGELAGELKSSGALVGLHCCGNTDWSMLAQIKAIDIISFDAFGFLERVLLYSDSIKNFLNRGGMLCWGIVPTSEFNDQIQAKTLVEMIVKGIEAFARKGINKDTLLKGLLLSPACGMGTLPPQRAKAVLEVLGKLSPEIKKLTN